MLASHRRDNWEKVGKCIPMIALAFCSKNTKLLMVERELSEDARGLRNKNKKT